MGYWKISNNKNIQAGFSCQKVPCLSDKTMFMSTLNLVITGGFLTCWLQALTICYLIIFLIPEYSTKNGGSRQNHTLNLLWKGFRITYFKKKNVNVFLFLFYLFMCLLYFIYLCVLRKCIGVLLFLPLSKNQILLKISYIMEGV